MLLAAHIGYTVGGAWAAQKTVLRRSVDFRWVAVMSVFPDIVDRALYAFALPDAQGGRLIAHTLLFNLVFLLVLVAIRRQWWIYGVASLGHLVLDSEGLALAHAFWPILGADPANLGLTGGQLEAVSYLDRVVQRLVRETSNIYASAQFHSRFLDWGGVVVLVAFFAGEKLYQPVYLWRFLTGGSAETREAEPVAVDPPKNEVREG